MRTLGIDLPAGRNMGLCLSDDGHIESRTIVLTENPMTDIRAALESIGPADLVACERPCGLHRATVGALWQAYGVIRMVAEGWGAELRLMGPAQVDAALGLHPPKGGRKQALSDWCRERVFPADSQHEIDAIGVCVAAGLIGPNSGVSEVLRASSGTPSCSSHRPIAGEG